MTPLKNFEFYLHFDNFKKKIKLTLAILCLNSLIILVLMALTYLVLDSKQIDQIVARLQWKKIYFYQLNMGNLLIVLRDYGFTGPILEEFLARYPVLMLIKSNLKIRIKYDLTMFFIILTALSLNLIWTNGLIIENFNIVFGHPHSSIPVFISGIPLYWLVIKTRSLWPAIVCHGASNVILYFFAQALLYFELIPKPAF